MSEMLPLSINATGFVSTNAGSVASANAVLLRGLLQRGHRVRFFTKPSFVDPRPVSMGTAEGERLSVVDCTNVVADRLRSSLSPSGSGLWGTFWGRVDARSYNQGLVRAMNDQEHGHLDLWMGDWARGRSKKRPVVSFVQGAPGTDARSIEQHKQQIVELAGRGKYEQLRILARLRLGIGLPPFSVSDHVIVGSQWSRGLLIDRYGLAANRVHACPYPIDLASFVPGAPRPSDEPLRLFWLGRFIPRKRLDLLLDGLAMAIDRGLDVEAWIVGRSGLVPGYEKLIQRFPFPERLQHWSSVPRTDVPHMLSQVDVMVQPSDEEDFGSSVAEALACGIPAIVGQTNGTGDYVCERSVRLVDDDPATMADAIERMAEAKQRGELAGRQPSRDVAEKWFAPARVVDRLEQILRLAASDSSKFSVRPLS